MTSGGVDQDPWDLGPEELCAGAGLAHVGLDAPGWSRRVQGTGFSYRNQRGAVLDAVQRERIESLAIPPAWSDVWICPHPDGHVLAAGRDDAGRMQRIYHPEFRAAAERTKYERLVPFGMGLERLRRTVVDDMGGDDARRRVEAAVVRLVDRGLVRIGSREPDDADAALGATTLTPDCVAVDVERGVIELEFTAKGGVDRSVRVEGEPLLARIIDDASTLRADVVFAYRDETGDVRSVSAGDVNAYLRETSGMAFTAKDFRTWGGTVTVAGALAEAGSPADDDEHHRALLAAVDIAAERLGNTRDVARASYVAPAVTDAHRDGSLVEMWARTRRGRWASRAERTTIRVLDAPT